jgi:hypothetical protein
MFTAASPDGARLTVKVLASEDRDRDRLTRLYRWLLVRDPEDDRAGPTVESAVEHEMLTHGQRREGGGPGAGPCRRLSGHRWPRATGRTGGLV